MVDVLEKYLQAIVTEIVNPILMLLAGGAFVIFLWGIFKFVSQAGEEDKRMEGRNAIMWSLVGLVIIFGAYGIMNIALGTFGIHSIAPVTKDK